MATWALSFIFILSMAAFPLSHDNVNYYDRFFLKRLRNLKILVTYLEPPHINQRGKKTSILKLIRAFIFPIFSWIAMIWGGHVCLSFCSCFCDSRLLTLLSKAEKNNYIAQGNPAVASPVTFPLSQLTQQVSSLIWSVSFNSEVPNSFYHIF